MTRSVSGPSRQESRNGQTGRSSSRLPLRVTGLASVLLVSLAAPISSCGTSDAPPAAASLSLTDCIVGGLSAKCGTFRVPEDRANPSARQIDLRVAVIPAKNAEPKPDPLFGLAGGPGSAATEEYSWIAETFLGLHIDRDIVLVDQRGTGGSNRLVLPEVPDVSGMSAADATSTLTAWSEKALSSLKGDMRFYTTSVAMDDLDAVRAAMGYDKINLYGGSYGTTAAQYYLRQHPDHVRAVVLDSGTLVDVPIFELIAPSSQRALDLVLARCTADAKCAGAHPNLEAELDAVLDRLAAAPETMPITDPATGEPFVLTADDLTLGVHSALLQSNYIGWLPTAIHAAYAQDWQEFARVAEALGDSGGSEENLAMTWAIRCSEAWARFDPAATATNGAGSYLGDAEAAIAEAQAATCAVLPKGVVADNDAEPVISDVPVLLLVGEADPQNPPANTADSAKELSNSLRVIVPGQAHGVAHLGCLPGVVTAFIEAGSVDGLDVACVDAMEPPTFQV